MQKETEFSLNFQKHRHASNKNATDYFTAFKRNTAPFFEAQ